MTASVLEHFVLPCTFGTFQNELELGLLSPLNILALFCLEKGGSTFLLRGYDSTYLYFSHKKYFCTFSNVILVMIK